MYCGHCGKKLDEGEICLCEILDETIEAPAENMPEPEPIYFSPQQPEKPAKKKPSWKKVLAGVIAGVISFNVFSFIFSSVFDKIFEDKEPESSETNIFEGIDDDFVIAPSDIEYIKGIVNGNTYSNPWANLKISMDSRFAEGTEEDYEAYESLLYDCGAYFYADDDGDDIGIIFYDAGSTTIIEYAEECLEIWENAANTTAEETYSEAVLQNITFKREARVVEIAGEEYLGVFLTAEAYGESYVVYGDFCAMRDGRIIDISFTGDSIEEGIALVQSFEICSGYNV